MDITNFRIILTKSNGEILEVMDFSEYTKIIQEDLPGTDHKTVSELAINEVAFDLQRRLRSRLHQQ